MSLMEMSFSGAVLILVILAARALLKEKLPKRTFAVLWMAALLRLLLPFSVPFSWSAYTLLQSVIPETGVLRSLANTISLPLSGDGFSSGHTGELPEGDPHPEQGPQSVQGIDAGRDAQSVQGIDAGRDAQSVQGIGAGREPQSAQGIDAGQNMEPSAISANGSEEMPLAAELQAVKLSGWTALWAAGFLIWLIFFTWMYYRCCREFRMSLPAENEIPENWYETHPLRRKLSIRQSDQITSPLSYGVWHPVILLSKSIKCGDWFRLRYVLEHEYIHIRYFDAAVKLLMAAALCVHWFNPFVYLMYFFFNRDLELACDETVVRRFGEEEKAAYAMALIELEEEKSGLLPLGNSFSKNAIEERISEIMKIKKITPLAQGLSVVLVCGITLLFATSCGTYGRAEEIGEAGLQMELSDDDENTVEYSEQEIINQTAELEQLIRKKEERLDLTKGNADDLVLEIEQMKENQEKLRLMLTDLERQNFFNELYGKYGIDYQLPENRLYKDKVPVRFFIDEENGGILWSDNDGEIVVEVVYDKEGKIKELSAEKIEDAETAVRETSESVAEDIAEAVEGATSEPVVEDMAEVIEEATSESVAEDMAEAIEGATSEPVAEDMAEAIEGALSESVAEDMAEAIEGATSESVAEDMAEAIEGATSEFVVEDMAESVKGATSESAGRAAEDVEESAYISSAYVISRSEEFREYKKYGLSYSEKTDHLMFKKQTVGYFKDETSPGVYTRFAEGSGELGIIVQRDRLGEIIGFQTFLFDEKSSSDSEVKEEGIEVPDKVSCIETSAAGEMAYAPGGSDVRENSIPEEYAEFGVTVSEGKTNQWMYKGKGVAALYDKEHRIYTNSSVPEKKAVYLEVKRNKKDRVTGLKEVTGKEMQKLFEEE